MQMVEAAKAISEGEAGDSGKYEKAAVTVPTTELLNVATRQLLASHQAYMRGTPGNHW